MPLFLVRCPLCGDGETYGSCDDGRFDRLTCPACGVPASQIFSPDHLFSARIDAAGEDSKHPARIADGSAHVNLGLPGVDTCVGKRANGTLAYEYRPLTHHEVGSNANAAEIAKRNNLIPKERAYRPLGSR